jgi:hypothetical protein
MNICNDKRPTSILNSKKCSEMKYKVENIPGIVNPNFLS